MARGRVAKPKYSSRSASEIEVGCGKRVCKAEIVSGVSFATPRLLSWLAARGSSFFLIRRAPLLAARAALMRLAAWRSLASALALLASSKRSFRL